MSEKRSEMPADRMWTLSEEQKSVRMEVPPLKLAGVAQPLSIQLDFDAAMVDEILRRLTVQLRSQMVPTPSLN